MTNIEKLAARLKEIDDPTSKYLWKPKEGKQIVRIVPYKFNPESPFIELKFYYKLAGKNYLAPCTFGKPDPIEDFVAKLLETGIKEQRELANKLVAKSRTYAPVIVRGEEELGVRFWGFGIMVYKQLLRLIVNPMWGDITGVREGNDMEVEFHKESKKKNKDGKSFPETIITPDPRKTPVVDPTRKDLIALLGDQQDILTLWSLPEYDELKEALNKYLHPEQAAPAVSADSPDETAGEDPTVEGDVQVTPVTPAVTPVTPTVAAPAAPAKTEDLSQTFEDLFNRPSA